MGSNFKKFEKANNEIDHLLSKAKENIVKYIKIQMLLLGRGQQT